MILMTPVGRVRSSRVVPQDDGWDAVTASIELDEAFDESAFDGLDSFSHAEILFHFDQVAEDAVERGTRHPRNNAGWPRVGIFAQRNSARPNRIGATIVRIKSRSGRVLTVAGLDAVDGTPVLDIKPVMTEFLPREPVRQPSWVSEMLRDYWKRT